MKSLMKKSNEKEISGNKIAKVKEKIKLFTLKVTFNIFIHFIKS